MRIAQVAPLYESVPPKLYGGTERVVSFLTEELARQGHEITLYAARDSQTAARLAAQTTRGLRLEAWCLEPAAPHFVMLEQVCRDAGGHDIVHFHTAPLHYPIARRLRTPSITTLHGRLDLPELAHLYREYDEVSLVSISGAQRAPLPWCSWEGTVYHGLPPDLFRYGDGGGGYLVVLGRISPEKGVDRAIAIARRAGMELRIAAKVDPADATYFRDVIRPLLGQPGIEFLGEVDEQHKQELLGNARALLFPIDWPEPFGLVMIESFACGTPVIAFPCGSVPEVMVEGVTGFVATDVDTAALAVQRVSALDRRACRRVFDQRFTAQRMASDYVALYQRVIGRATLPSLPSRRHRQ